METFEFRPKPKLSATLFQCHLPCFSFFLLVYKTSQILVSSNSFQLFLGTFHIKGRKESKSQIPILSVPFYLLFNPWPFYFHMCHSTRTVFTGVTNGFQTAQSKRRCFRSSLTGPLFFIILSQKFLVF